MPSVPISDEVFEAIQRKAVPLVDTVDSVLRRVLGLEAEQQSDKAGKLLPLLKAGLLEPDDELLWRRPQLGEAHRATVLATGCIRLADGRIATSPSGACSALSSTSVDGWEEWRRASDDVRLDELRQRAGIPVHRRKSRKSGEGERTADS
ncbi:hypothetical protein ACFQ1S_00640 [Kibdelosporangium lantanae]|uniref:RAMA domain-containing protein n=1 Tax=Kibdelosporangium lantanae TaxID=1497396 RepID=A0ABW3M0J0_9PSEU